MQFTCKPLLALLLGSLAITRGHAETLAIDVELPRIDSAHYHHPYVALWLENDDRSVVQDLSVWYAKNKANDEGKKWLKDLRRWWRVSGRNHDEPADGVSGATRAAGHHTLHIPDTDARLSALPPGHYTLAVEAAREKGGHELIRLDLPWPPQAHQAQATGQQELGQVQLRITP